MADRSAAAKKAAKTLKMKRAGQKAAVTRKRRAAAKKAAATRKVRQAKSITASQQGEPVPTRNQTIEAKLRHGIIVAVEPLEG